VTIALTPLLLGLFQQVSLISPIANAFAIPLVSLVVVPLALVGTLIPFDHVLLLAHQVMLVTTWLLEGFSALPDATWEQHAPPAWTIAAAVLGTCWLLLPRGAPARWLGVVACLPLLFVPPPRVEPGALRVALLDVGQGLAVVFQTQRHALLYDAGPAFGATTDSGNRIIAPYLRAAGVRRLDGMIVSHDDTDHSGGAASVLQALPVDWLSSSLPDMDPLPLVAEEAFRCTAGQSWEWDGVRFDILHPAPAAYETRMKTNDRGCVLKVTAPGGSVLVPGDIERPSEERLLRDGKPLGADILVAPHHGSRTSSTPAFVEAVKPRHVIFAVGYRNRLGHPHPDVVERWKAGDAHILRTDRDGALLVTIVPHGPIRIERNRALYRRYWLDAPVDGPSYAHELSAPVQ
jgi:competence protein ComEC